MLFALMLTSLGTIFFFICFCCSLRALEKRDIKSFHHDVDMDVLSQRLDDSEEDKRKLDKYIQTLGKDNTLQQRELMEGIKKEAKLTGQVESLNEAVGKLYSVIRDRRNEVIESIVRLVENHDFNVDEVFPGDGV